MPVLFPDKKKDSVFLQVKMQFAEVSLAEWDCAKVFVRKPTMTKAGQSGDPVVTYDGKLPILVVRSVDATKPYILSSSKGIQENKTWIPAPPPGHFSDTWEGDWSISYKVCVTVKGASVEEKKLMAIFDDIFKKTQKFYKSEKVKCPINYSWNKEVDPESGAEEIIGVDESKGAYLKVKVGYEGLPNAEMIIDKAGKSVPALTLKARKPKPTFYDMSRDRDHMVVQDPAKECQTGMNAIVKIFIGLYKNSQGVFITKKLLQCYYNPVAIGSNTPDEDIIDSFGALKVSTLMGQN